MCGVTPRMEPDDTRFYKHREMVCAKFQGQGLTNRSL